MALIMSYALNKPRSKCDSTQVYVKNGHTHCIDHCKATTMCGEVQVPNEHLDVSRNQLTHHNHN